MTTFSIIIPCHNDAEYLPRALDSALGQTHCAEEVIVVDDGSTDTTADVCARYGVAVRALHQDNQGVSAARNTGIDATATSYLVFLDADDELKSYALEKYAQRARPDARWLIGNCEWERDGKIRSRTIELPRDRENRFIAYLEKRLHIGNISNMCFARSLFEQLRFDPDLRFSEDLALFAVLFTQTDPVLVPHVTALAHRRADSLRNRISLDALRESKAVSSVFQHPLLDAAYRRHTSPLLARQSRSIMKRAYREQNYAIATASYEQMISYRPYLVLDIKLLFRYLRARLAVGRRPAQPKGQQ